VNMGVDETRAYHLARGINKLKVVVIAKGISYIMAHGGDPAVLNQDVIYAINAVGGVCDPSSPN